MDLRFCFPTSFVVGLSTVTGSEGYVWVPKLVTKLGGHQGRDLALAAGSKDFHSAHMNTCVCEA